MPGITSAAINSTLFSSANLAKRVSEDRELPGIFRKTTGGGTPYAAILCFGVLAAILSVTGSLSDLVEAASLVFLATFLTVNLICIRRLSGRIIPLTGFILGLVLAAALVWRLAHKAPVSLGIVLCLDLVAYFVRPLLLRQTKDGSQS